MKTNKKINLSKLEDYKICAVGEYINNNYDEHDIRYYRAVVCENSYIEIITEKGYEILNELKEKYNF